MELSLSSYFTDIFHNTNYTTICPAHPGEHVSYFQVLIIMNGAVINILECVLFVCISVSVH